MNLDQWASTDRAWQNGNLNGNNSRYPEGGIVPFRAAFEGLKAGNHSIHINYDFTAERAQGLRLPGDVERHQRRGQGLQRERGWRSRRCVPGRSPLECRVPVGSIQGQRASVVRGPRSTPARRDG